MNQKSKEITFFGKQVTLSCDGNCNKAWGINSRPSERDPADDWDFVTYLSDGELGEAPADPGTYEGAHGKPTDGTLNKWCARECERSVIVDRGKEVKLPDRSKRFQ